MGPTTMPPSKKAQSPSSALPASRNGVATGGGGVIDGGGDLSPLYREAEAADLSLSLSASFSSRASSEDEELTSLSWLHESSNLLNSFGGNSGGLRSVSPILDPAPRRSDSTSSSPSPDPAPYDLSANGGGGGGGGASRKPPYSFSCLIFMAIEDAPNKRLPVKDIYGWILEHFPYFASAPTGWKNSVRHNLSLNKCFKKVDKDRSQSIGKGSLWSIDPEYRHNLIQALKKTPYHPYSPGLITPSASPPHSPPLWPGNSFFRKNGGVLLQVAGGVIQNGSHHVRSQSLFPVIRPLPISPVGSRTSAIRSALGSYLSRGHTPCDLSPSGEDLSEDDHTYGRIPSMPCSSQGPASSPCHHDDDGNHSNADDGSNSDDDIIAVEIRDEVKPEPRDVPLDSSSPFSPHSSPRSSPFSPLLLPSSPVRRVRPAVTPAAVLPPWTKNRLRATGETLPLKKRRAAAETTISLPSNQMLAASEKPPESDDEEMKEAAGSLLHLAGVRGQGSGPAPLLSNQPLGVRACLNNIIA